MISQDSSWAISGIHHNMQLFNQTANRITDPETTAGISDIMQLKLAEHGIKVNVSVLKIANELSDNVIDILT